MRTYKFITAQVTEFGHCVIKKEFIFDTYQECEKQREICKCLSANDPNIEVSSIIDSGDEYDPNTEVSSIIDSGERHISWDEYFMNIAILASLRSKDTTKVGSVLVKNKKVIGMGYNGFPAGVDETKLPTARTGNDLSETKYAYTIHAEQNCLLNTSLTDISNSTLYVTLFPCCRCVATLMQCGVEEIVYLSDKHHDDPEYVASRKLLSLSGIKVRQYNERQFIKFN